MQQFRAFLRILAVAFVVSSAFAAVHMAPYGDVGASITDVSGSTVTILVTNPSPDPTAVEVSLTVRLDDDTIEPLTSNGVFLDGYESEYVEVQASGVVAAILDGAEPFPY